MSKNEKAYGHKNTTGLLAGGVNAYIANPSDCLAGVAFSCISRVSPVNTIGVWSLRNLPPQAITWVYPLLLYDYCTLHGFCNHFITHIYISHVGSKITTSICSPKNTI